MKKILTILLLAAVLCACGPTAAPAPEKPAPEKPQPTVAPAATAAPTAPATGDGIQPDAVSPEAQLLAKTETEAEAEELAELYGITLVKYRNGLARFHTEEDPRAVIRRGQENGWPELTLNRVSKPA